MLLALILASVALLTLIAPASAFVVVNEASFSAIHKLYLAPAKSNAWGEDKLQNQTVAENGRFTVLDIPAGAYDVKIIDDVDASCVVAEININENKELRLTDEMMLQCAFKAKERPGL